LSYLRVQDQERFQYTQDAIHEFETALADGPQVELERLDLLAKLWCLNLPTDESQRATLAVDLEHSVHRAFHDERVNGDIDVPFEVKEKNLCISRGRTIHKTSVHASFSGFNQ
jgi:hypothetical protein